MVRKESIIGGHAGEAESNNYSWSGGGEMGVFEIVCTEERLQSLTLSSVEGEELRAGAWGWGRWQRQRKLYCTLICSTFLVVWEYICQLGRYLWRLLKLIVFLHFCLPPPHLPQMHTHKFL